MGGDTAIEKHHREGQHGDDGQVAGNRLPEHVRHHQQHDQGGGYRSDDQPLAGLGKIGLLDLGVAVGILRLVGLHGGHLIAGPFHGALERIAIGAIGGNTHRDAMAGDIGVD